MLWRLLLSCILAGAAAALASAAAIASNALPPVPVNIGLPPPPTIIDLPEPSRLRPGVAVRRADGRLAFIAAPRPAPKPPAVAVISRYRPAQPQQRAAGGLPPPAVGALVEQLAPRYGLDPDLVVAVIATESSFQVDAVSPRGAAGLMQLMPETARRFGVDDSYDPAQNLHGGMAYLRWLLSYFRGDLRLALAAYNAGERAVERHAGVPPYSETQNYVVKVMRAYAKSGHTFDPGVTKASPLINHRRDGS